MWWLLPFPGWLPIFTHGAVTLSLKSISKSIWLLISCHCLISFVISTKIAFRGQSKWFNPISPLVCCWYIIRGLSSSASNTAAIRFTRSFGIGSHNDAQKTYGHSLSQSISSMIGWLNEGGIWKWFSSNLISSSATWLLWLRELSSSLCSSLVACFESSDSEAFELGLLLCMETFSSSSVATLLGGDFA